MTATHAPETVLKRHPISGILFGAMLGIGVAIYLVLFSITPFAWATLAIVVGAGAVVGFLWGMFAPAKQVREMPQADHQPMFTRVGEEDPNPPSYEQAFGSSTSSRGAFAAGAGASPTSPGTAPVPAPPEANPPEGSSLETTDEPVFGHSEEPPTTDS